jgi:imidazolonepropionase-like amidohydrolase
LHLEDRVGSIDVGRDADLVILSGEPFDFASRVEKVLVNGRIVFERQE